MHFKDILANLKNVRPSGTGSSAKCPYHADQNNSLSITNKGGATLMNCFAGCDINDICAAIGIELKDLYADNPGEPRPVASATKRIKEVYTYKDELGDTIFEKVRYEPKQFAYRVPRKDGGYDYSLGNTRRVPYHLDELIKTVHEGREILLCEGEKDADRLRDLGFSTSSFKDWKPEFNEFIKSARVVLLTDHDESGIKQSQDAARRIFESVVSLKVVDPFASEELPAGHGKDISDWIDTLIDSGGDGDQVCESLSTLIENAQGWKPNEPANETKPRTLAVTRMSDVVVEPINWLWNPYLAIGTFSILEGEEGVGKTYVALALAAAVSNGRGLPNTAQEHHIGPSKVLIISSEDSPSHVLKPRLDLLGARNELISIFSHAFTLDKEGLERLSHTLAELEPTLVILDPLFSFTGKVNLNNDNEIRSVTDPLKRLAERHNCVILGIRHVGKAKGYGDPRIAGLNGVGWRASARSVLLVGKSPDDDNKRALAMTKSNLAAIPEKSIGFSIEKGHFHWTGSSDLTAKMMLAYAAAESIVRPKKTDDAKAFIVDHLSDGPKSSIDILEASVAAGLSMSTIRRAKKELDVQAVKNSSANGSWTWILPPSEGDQISEDAH